MGNKNIRNILYIVGLIFFILPVIAQGVNLTSPNYQLENPSWSTGGGTRSSATYGEQDAAGGSSSTGSSNNYKLQSGAIPPIFPGVPGVPTLTNTGGTLYNALDFVINTGGNASDIAYAIAISSDNFVTTEYVQTTDTIGPNPAWQTYANWGSSSGHRLVQLAPNTIYKIKVKARIGIDAESGFSSIATASTVNPTLTVAVAGVTSGTTIAGATTNVTTTATGVSFGTISSGSIRIGAYTLTVSTNATAGYTTKVYQNGDLLKSNGVTIPPVSGTNSSPAAWPSGFTDARFGYHTTDSSLCTGTTNRFASNDTFAKAETAAYEIACSSSSVTNEQTSIVYKVEAGALQPPGDYQNKIDYITTPQF